MMKRTIFSIALLALMLFATSSLNRGDAVIKVGELAPEIVLTNTQESLSISQLKGEYVLLTFWNSTDAKSRVECNKYSTWFDSNRPSNLRFLAVNLDSEPLLFEEIAKRDQMDMDNQFNVLGQSAKQIEKEYHLDHGYGSVLIGPDGRVMEIDPKISELTSLVKS